MIDQSTVERCEAEPMQTTPTPRYSIGNKVFAADSPYVETKVQCPDCLGSREVEVHTPSGDVFPVPCGTCHLGWCSEGVIRQYVDQPQVLSLTVGSVRIDTADEHPVSYMANETGVGSGRVWNEDGLFDSYEAAMQVAKEKASAQAVQRNEQEAKRRDEEKKKAKRKPSWEKRRIRELEEQIKQMASQAVSK